MLEQEALVAVSSASSADYAANGGADALLRNLAQDYSHQAGATINSDLSDLLNANPPDDQGDLVAIDGHYASSGHPLSFWCLAGKHKLWAMCGHCHISDLAHSK